MRRFLFVSAFISYLFCLGAKAQSNQIVVNGAPTTTATYPRTGCVYKWTNSNPSIGLPASGIGDIASFNAVNKGTIPVTATITATPVASGYAYIANAGSNNVSVISTLTNKTIAVVPVDASPWAVAVLPGGNFVYVANRGSNDVSVIDTKLNRVVATVPVGSRPTGIVASADGSRVYMCNKGANTISVISTPYNEVVSVISGLGDPYDLALSPDDKYLYVTNPSINRLSVINLSTNSIIASIPVQQDPIAVAVSPNGKYIYVTSGYGIKLSVIDAATNKVIAGVQLPSEGDGLALSPDGNHVYVTDATSAEVLDINAKNYKIEAAIKLPSGPDGVSITPDGNFLYTANRGNSVSIIDTRSDRLLRTLPAGAYPNSIGSFITPVLACVAAQVSFTITVNPALSPAIVVTPAKGTISSYVGKASSSPNIQQFTISGNNLKAFITATAPPNFQISTNARSGYANTLYLLQSGGILKNKVIYVRSSSSAVAGSITGKIILSSAGAMSQTVAVKGVVNALPAISPIADQTVVNGASTTAVSFPGTGCVYKWTNSNPAIGLPASGIGNIPSFKAVNNSNTPVTATITATPEPSGYAYVTNANSNSVSVINTATNTVVTTIPVGEDPQGVSALPDGSYVYVVDPISNIISVIDTKINQVITTINTSGAPIGIAASPDDSRIYVSNQSANNVSVIDTKSNQIISTIQGINHPFQMVVSPDDKYLYVTNPLLQTLSIIDLSTNLIKASVSVPNPQAVAVLPNGRYIYTTTQSGGGLSVIDAATNQVVSTVPIPYDTEGLVVSPDGSRIYVSSGSDPAVFVVNTQDNTVENVVKIPYASYGVSITPDGKYLYAVHRENLVSAIDTKSNQLISTVKVGFAPVSFGNFTTPVFTCNASPVTFTITVDPTPPSSITTTAAAGSISSCAGTASASPNIQQFTLSGSSLTGDVTATAPPNFEISANAGSGYANSLTIHQSGGTLNSTVIYVRSSLSATTGSISGNVTLSSAGAASQTVAVNGIVNALPRVNPVANQTVTNGAATNAINFTGTADNYTWVNDTPGIGLVAGGSGGIPVFTASNTGKTELIANITVTPQSGNGCSGFPVTFTIAIDPTPPAAIDFSATAIVSLTTTYGTPSASTSFNLSAVNLRAGVLITPPPGFEVSFDNNMFSKTVTAGSTGTLATTTVYIRLAATTGVGFYQGDVNLNSNGATDTNFGIDKSEVTPAMLILKASDVDKAYGTTLTGGPGPLAFGVTGLKNLETIGTVTINYGAGALATDPVKTYPGSVLVSSATGGTFNPANYIINYIPGDIIITAEPLLATVDNKSKVFGAINPVFTITYSGFVNNENASVFTDDPVITTTALTNSPAGQYPVTASGAVAQNYTFTYIPGILTVTAPYYEIIIPNTFTPNGDGINDLWDIKYLNLYPKCTVNVYTRYGEKVYSSVGYGVSWDGTFKGAQLPTGTYYYVIDPKSGIKIMAGYITIIR